jgi:hypothetical protein
MFYIGYLSVAVTFGKPASTSETKHIPSNIVVIDIVIICVNGHLFINKIPLLLHI